jgi:two-component system cell cycle sensor histidine kinase/response regulator CckA
MSPNGSHDPLQRIQELEQRLEEAEETLRALRSGEVDAIVVSRPDGEVVYTLKGADEPYRLLVQQMGEGAVTISPDGLILFANEQFAAMLATPLERIAGARLHDFIAPDFTGAFSALLAGNLDDSAKAEVRLKCAAGAPVPAFLSARRLTIEGTECISVVATDLTEQKRSEEMAREIAARKRVEADLRKSEARERERARELEAILEAAPAAILIARDRECRHISGNRHACNLFRVPPGTNFSKTEGREKLAAFRLLRNGEEIPIEQLPPRAAARTGRVVEACELTVEFNDGSRREIVGGGVPLLDEGGQPRGSVAAFMDITDRKRAEEALRQSQKLESIGLLAGGIAHDFNNLLVSIIGSASLVQEIVNFDPAAAELLDTIVKTGEEAAHLTRQLLAYAGKGQFVISPLDLSQTVREISALVRPSVSKRISFVLDLEEELPAVEADRGQIQQVFMNLALNASEAIGSGPGVISVSTGARSLDQAAIRAESWTGIEPGNYVFLEVRDTGRGMSEAAMAKIFDPFFTTKSMGRGLGLAAVSGIVRGHKGAIKVASSPGKGTCFTVLFPASSRKAADTRMATITPAEIRGSGTILVVDDEPGVRRVAEATLGRHGFKVLQATNGRESIEIFRQAAGEIALILLDLSMPGMGGEEALPELLKVRSDVKVLVSSGYSETESLSAFHGLPVSGFIQKPYTSAELAQKIIDALG